MSAARETVVVTGLGATTPLGGDVASTWSAMLAGTSGVRRIEEPWAEDLPVKIAAMAAVDPVVDLVPGQRPGPGGAAEPGDGRPHVGA